jgi:hypothetical protein
MEGARLNFEELNLAFWDAKPHRVIKRVMRVWRSWWVRSLFRLRIYVIFCFKYVAISDFAI